MVSPGKAHWGLQTAARSRYRSGSSYSAGLWASLKTPESRKRSGIKPPKSQRHLCEPQWQKPQSDRCRLSFYTVVFVFVCRYLCSDKYLFENHELIQEVNTLACKEFPDGLLPLEALRVSGGAHLGRLVLQELQQRVVLHKGKQIRGKTYHIKDHHHPNTVCDCLCVCWFNCLEILVLAQALPRRHSVIYTSFVWFANLNMSVIHRHTRLCLDWKCLRLNLHNLHNKQLGWQIFFSPYTSECHGASSPGSVCLRDIFQHLMLSPSVTSL